MDAKSNKRTVSDALFNAALAHGKGRTDEIRQRWLEAKKNIEGEMEENEGVYPHNKGRVDIKEICRRAAISQQTLYAKAGPHRATTFIEITQWCESLAVKKMPEIRKAVTHRVEFWKAELQKVATQICKYELDSVEKDRVIRMQQEENVKLKLLLRGSKPKLVKMPPGSSEK